MLRFDVSSSCCSAIFAVGSNSPTAIGCFSCCCIDGFHRSFRRWRSSGRKPLCVGTAPAPSLLELEITSAGRASAHRAGVVSSNPKDERRERALGCPAHSGRAAQAIGFNVAQFERRQVHDQGSRAGAGALPEKPRTAQADAAVGGGAPFSRGASRAPQLDGRSRGAQAIWPGIAVRRMASLRSPLALGILAAKQDVGGPNKRGNDGGSGRVICARGGR